MLWDAIFADSISFDLVDYVFVAMLLYIRDASQSCHCNHCSCSVVQSCLVYVHDQGTASSSIPDKLLIA